MNIIGTNSKQITVAINSNSIQNNEYLNRLVLENVRESDAGMYICFVTNSGFGALTYKSMNLRVVRDKIVTPPGGKSRNDVNRNLNEEGGEPLDILIPVICLSVVVFILIGEYFFEGCLYELPPVHTGEYF